MENKNIENESFAMYLVKEYAKQSKRFFVALIVSVIAMEEQDGEYSNYYPYSYDNYSYARGRGGNARRDSMGRYSHDNYSGNYSRDHSETISKMRNLMNETSDDRTRREIQRLISEMENG